MPQITEVMPCPFSPVARQSHNAAGGAEFAALMDALPAASGQVRGQPLMGHHPREGGDAGPVLAAGDLLPVVGEVPPSGDAPAPPDDATFLSDARPELLFEDGGDFDAPRTEDGTAAGLYGLALPVLADEPGESASSAVGDDDQGASGGPPGTAALPARATVIPPTVPADTSFRGEVRPVAGEPKGEAATTAASPPSKSGQDSPHRTAPSGSEAVDASPDRAAYPPATIGQTGAPTSPRRQDAGPVGGSGADRPVLLPTVGPALDQRPMLKMRSEGASPEPITAATDNGMARSHGAGEAAARSPAHGRAGTAPAEAVPVLEKTAPASASLPPQTDPVRPTNEGSGAHPGPSAPTAAPTSQASFAVAWRANEVGSGGSVDPLTAQPGPQVRHTGPETALDVPRPGSPAHPVRFAGAVAASPRSAMPAAAASPEASSNAAEAMGPESAAETTAPAVPPRAATASAALPLEAALASRPPERVAEKRPLADATAGLSVGPRPDFSPFSLAGPQGATDGDGAPTNAPTHHAPAHRQLSDAIVATHDDRVEILLAPEELGRVRMTIAHDGSRHISIVAERPETLELLRRHADRLTDDLRDKGWTDPQIDFRRADDRADGNRPDLSSGQQDRRDPDQRQRPAQPPFAARREASPPEPPRPTSTPRLDAARLDIRL